MEKTVHYEKTLTSEVLFEGRVITLTKDTALLENGICSAAFCESAALRETNPLRLTAPCLRGFIPLFAKKITGSGKAGRPKPENPRHCSL